MSEQNPETIYRFAADQVGDPLSPEYEHWQELRALAHELTDIPETIAPNILTEADLTARCHPGDPFDHGGWEVAVHNREKISRAAEVVIVAHEQLQWHILNELKWFNYGDQTLVSAAKQEYGELSDFATALRELSEHIVTLEDPEHRTADAQAVVLFSAMFYLRPLLEKQQISAVERLRNIIRSGVRLESSVEGSGQ